MCPNEAMRDCWAFLGQTRRGRQYTNLLPTWTPRTCTRTHIYKQRPELPLYNHAREEAGERERGTRGTNQTPADTLTHFSQLSVRRWQQQLCSFQAAVSKWLLTSTKQCDCYCFHSMSLSLCVFVYEWTWHNVAGNNTKETIVGRVILITYICLRQENTYDSIVFLTVPIGTILP